MKFSVNPTQFAKSMTLAKSIIAPNSPIPAATNVLIQSIDDSTISLSATNFSQDIYITLPASISEPGEVAADAKKITDWSSFAKQDVDISVSNQSGKLVFKQGKTTMSLSTIDTADLPIARSIKFSPVTEMPSESLVAAIDAVAFAASADASRSVSNVLFALDGKQATFFAVDGTRLASISYPDNSGKQIKFLVLADLLKTARKIFSGTSGTVEIATLLHAQTDAPTRLVLRSGNITLSSQCSDIEYIDHTKMLETFSGETPVSVNRIEFRDTLKQVMVALDENVISVLLTLEDGNLSIETYSFGGETPGSAKAFIPATGVSPINYTYSALALKDILTYVPSATISIAALDRLNALLVRGDGENSNAIYAIAAMVKE